MLARTLGDRLATIRQSVLLLGPRQVGKSTLLKGLKPQRYLNLADESLFLAYSKVQACFAVSERPIVG